MYTCINIISIPRVLIFTDIWNLGR